MPVEIRGFEAGDIEALYTICLKTADAGQDGTALYADPKLIGHLYAAPYAMLEPEHTLVAADEQGVAGYLVGTYDTQAFAERQERDWWPTLRARYPDPRLPDDDWTPDQRRSFSLHHPTPTPADIVDRFPAHIHMNLLPRLQGSGTGTALLRSWLERAEQDGVAAVHLGANTANVRGVAFWQSRGFEPLRTAGTTIWFGMRLPRRTIGRG